MLHECSNIVNYTITCMEEIACNILYYIWFQQAMKISGPVLFEY